MNRVKNSIRSLRAIGDIGDKTDYDNAVTASLFHMMKPWEYVITPDHFGCWKRHVAWAKSDGKVLREHTTQRFASSMVFISLLLNANLVILFNSSDVCSRIRRYLYQGAFHRLEFYIGLVLIVSVFCTLFAILATFTVWGMVSVISDENAVCVIRSSIGQYATQLPSRLVASSLLLFITWSAMFLFILLPPWMALFGFMLGISIYLHVVSVYSAFGRLLMHSGAMGSKPIISQIEEQCMLPADLHERLGECAEHHFERKTSVTAQYMETQSVKQEDDARRRSSCKYFDVMKRAAYTKMHRVGGLSECANIEDLELALSGDEPMPEEVIFEKDENSGSRFVTWDLKEANATRFSAQRRGGQVHVPEDGWKQACYAQQSLETLVEVRSADNLTTSTTSQGSDSPLERIDLMRQARDDEVGGYGLSGGSSPLKVPRASHMDTSSSKRTIDSSKHGRGGLVGDNSETRFADSGTVDEGRHLLSRSSTLTSASPLPKYS